MGQGGQLADGWGLGLGSHGWTDSHKEKVGDFFRVFLLDFDLPKEGRRSQFVP